MELYRSQKGEEDIETEWRCLRHNNTGSTIKARVTVYSCYCTSEPCMLCSENPENSSHDQRVESIHFLIELYRKGEDR